MLPAEEPGTSEDAKPGPTRLCARHGAFELLPDCESLHADKGYDANAIRRRSKTAARRRTSRPRPIANGFSPFLYRNRKPSSACFVARTFARVARRWSGIVTALWACGVLGGRVAQRSSELTRPVEMIADFFADKKYPSMAPT